MIRVGPAGWSYADWEGVVYPSPRPRSFDPLEFLSRRFDIVEIDSSFYRPPDPRWAPSWVERVGANPRFVFTAKLWRVFTHERAGDFNEEERAFREGIDPLAAAGRLACVLMQFPHSFNPSPESRSFLAVLADRFSDYPLAVELRREDWKTPDTLEWLAQRRIAFCNIDQPLIGHGGGATLRPGEIVTAPHAYARLHGRNRDVWFSRQQKRDARYDYLYTPEELEPWISRIRGMAQRAEEVHVITNNHFRGKAVVNALMIRSMLEGRPMDASDEMLAAYPALSSFAKTPDQGRLF